MLAPTDPVLASSTVSGHAAEETVPVRVRRALSLESGANDGLGFLLVTAALFFAVDHDGGWLTAHMIGSVAGGGIAVGALAGWLTARLVGLSRAGRHQTEGTFLLFTLTFSVFVLALSGVAGLDGILAVFVAGVVYKSDVDDEIRASHTPPTTSHDPPVMAGRASMSRTCDEPYGPDPQLPIGRWRPMTGP